MNDELLDTCREERQVSNQTDLTTPTKQHQNEREALMAIYSLEDESSPVRITYNEATTSADLCVDVNVARNIRIRVTLPNERKKSTCEEIDDVKYTDRLETTVRSLPPLQLRVTLPERYPLEEAPIVEELRGKTKWLSDAQASRLTSNLAQVAQANLGDASLFALIDHLQSEALRPDARESIITFDIDCNQLTDTKEAAQEIYNALVSKARDETEKHFASATEHTCEVCDSERLTGAECIMFQPCAHVSCMQCARQYYRMHVHEGTLSHLLCPAFNCSSVPTQSQIKSILDDDTLYERYELLTLNRAFDAMMDIAICPRPSCAKPVIVEMPPPSNSGNGGEEVKVSVVAQALTATCAHCNYSFCTFCRKSNHGVENCTLSASERQRILTSYENADADTKRLMEQRYGRRTLLSLLEDIRSDKWIGEHSKRCPKCRAPTERIDGCNKMHCSKCRANWCWLCTKAISDANPYNHFNAKGSDCFNQLFAGIEEPDTDDDEDWILSDESETESESDDEEAVVLRLARVRL